MGAQIKSFNPDPSKQPQEVIFSRKTIKNFHPRLNFNDKSYIIKASRYYT